LEKHGALEVRFGRRLGVVVLASPQVVKRLQRTDRFAGIGDVGWAEGMTHRAWLCVWDDRTAFARMLLP
jgi:hypothetical protein